MTLKRINTPDQNLQLIQDNTNAALIPLQAIPMVEGIMLTGVNLKTGQDNQVAHKLNRTPRFFILSNQDTNTNVWATAFTSQFITVQCGADCTVSLWVN